MAIIIKLDYGKKLGLPQYSSHQFSVSLTAEVSDIVQVKAETERLYGILQDAVDSQIVHTGYTPGETVAVPTGGAPATPAPDAWCCSEKQRDLILTIVERNRLDKGDIEALAKDRFGAGVKQLNKLQASGLIDELMETYGGAQAEKPRFTGNRSAPRRSAAYAARRVS